MTELFPFVKIDFILKKYIIESLVCGSALNIYINKSVTHLANEGTEH